MHALLVESRPAYVDGPWPESRDEQISELIQDALDFDLALTPDSDAEFLSLPWAIFHGLSHFHGTVAPPHAHG